MSTGLRMVVVGLGANLGDRVANLEAAVTALHNAKGVEVVATSPIYETEPLGPPQPRYLNAAARLSTALPLRELLDLAQAIETDLGRIRSERWGPRPIDIDILWAEGETVDEPGLVVPHTGLFDRAFALAPLLDVLTAAPAEHWARLDALGGPPPLHRRTVLSPK